MSVKQAIEAKIRLALRPTELSIVDESDQHAGHSGWREGGETHFRVYVTSRLFEGKSRVERHRMINDLLKDELATSVHALAIHASTGMEQR